MSSQLPQLTTPRLLLRALQTQQAERLFTLANGPKIADNTARIPSPYTLETAQEFIDGMQEKFRSNGLLSLGMHRRDTDECHEGCLRGAFLKNGVYEDLLVFATLREDWERRH